LPDLRQIQRHPTVSKGAETMKMYSSTSMTSTIGDVDFGTSQCLGSGCLPPSARFLRGSAAADRFF